jgi:hypothetical protein
VYWSLTYEPSALPFGLTGLADASWRRLRQVEFDFRTTLLHSVDIAHYLDIYQG